MFVLENIHINYLRKTNINENMDDIKMYAYLVLIINIKYVYLWQEINVVNLNVEI